MSNQTRCRTAALRAALTMGLAGAMGASLAATVDPATVLNSARQTEAKPQITAAPTTEQPAAPLVPAPRPGQTTFVLKTFAFEGDVLLPEAVLQNSLAPWIGQTVDFAGVRAAADLLVSVFRESGYLVRVDLPRQNVSSGDVKLAITAARFGQLQVQQDPGSRADAAQATARLGRHLKAGEVLKLDALDRGLLLADDLAGVSVGGALAAGSQPGTTDLVVKMLDEPLWQGEASVDNYGSVSTGRGRANARLLWNSPKGNAKTYDIYLSRTEHSQYTRLGHSAALDPDGWKWTLGLGRLDYNAHLTGFVSGGWAQSLDTGMSYPLVRSRRKNLNLDLAFSRNHSFSDTGPKTDITDTVTIGLRGNWFDAKWGGGANAYSLKVNDGFNHADYNGALSTQHYTTINADYSRQQALSEDTTLWLNLKGQWANAAVASGGAFYIGGNSSVRAYPGSEGKGDMGESATVEWRRMLNANWQMAAFYDWGHVHNLTQLDGGILRGPGLSVSWKGGKGQNVSVAWAQRQGESPWGKGGKDAVGTRIYNRIWASVAMNW